LAVIRFSQAGIRTFSKTNNALAGHPTKRIGIAGYFMAGQFDTSMEKFTFPSDTRSVISNALSFSRPEGAGMANAGVAGYQGGGGDSGGRTTAIDKIAFPADTRTTLGTGLSQDKNILGAMANPAVAGYFGGGGTNTGSPNVTSQVDKFAFPSDTRTTLGTGLSQSRTVSGGFSNPEIAGYFCGGYDGNTASSIVDKFAFPSDTRSTLALSSANSGGGAFADRQVAGYYGFSSTTVDKFAFPSDTRSNLATGLGFSGSTRCGMANSGVAGYIHMGSQSPEPRTVQINKFSFPTDTRSGLGLSTDRTRMSAFANEGL
jgi:hypothetical protein